jgi:hypothetical protein
MQRRQLLKGLLGLTALPLVPKFLSLGRVQAFSYYTNHITSTIMPVLVPRRQSFEDMCSERLAENLHDRADEVFMESVRNELRSV